MVPLFEIQPEAIVAVPSTTFGVEQVLDRADLQRLLRAQIGVIADEVLVVSEEFGAFTETWPLPPAWAAALCLRVRDSRLNTRSCR